MKPSRLAHSYCRTIAAIPLFLFAAGCQPRSAQAVEHHTPASAPPRYVAGELIVKLSQHAGAVVEAALHAGRPLRRLGLAWFDELNARYGVHSIGPVFTTVVDIDAIRRKYPERARRATPDAQDPHLKYIYKLTLRAATDILKAAADYASHPDVEYAHPNYLATTQHDAPVPVTTP